MNFITAIVVTRLLSPADFGLVAMLEIFLTLSMIFVDSGFSNALIRRKNRSREDESTVFLCNLCAAIVLYLVLFFAAPWISEFYGRRELTVITRLLGLTLPLGALGMVQQIRLQADLRFKLLANVNLASVVISAIVTIICALSGWGVWSLVAQQLTFSAMRSILLWITVSHRLSLRFFRDSFHEMFSFGWKLMASSIINTFYTNIYSVLIGRIFSAASAGYFWRAQTLSRFPAVSFNSIVQGVSYPSMSKLQDDRERLRSAYSLMIRMSAWGLFPLMIWLSFFAPQAVTLLFSDRWLTCAPYLRIIAPGLMLYPIHSLNLNLLNVKGRSDIFLKLEVIKTLIGLTFLAIGCHWGVIGICWGMLAHNISALFINTICSGPLIGLGVAEQLRFMAAPLIMGGISSTITFLIMSAISLPTWLLVFLSLAVTAGIYLLLTKLFTPGLLKEFNSLIILMRHRPIPSEA